MRCQGLHDDLFFSQHTSSIFDDFDGTGWQDHLMDELHADCSTHDQYFSGKFVCTLFICWVNCMPTSEIVIQSWEYLCYILDGLPLGFKPVASPLLALIDEALCLMPLLYAHAENLC